MPYQSILGEDRFASGTMTYRASEGEESRMRLLVKFGGKAEVYAIVDTGAPHCILSPETFELVQDVCDVLFTGKMMIRGEIYNGVICRLPIYLEAEVGESIMVDGTAFAIQLRPHQTYDLPDFIGLSGFLERIRYAVDPADSQFYFANV